MVTAAELIPFLVIVLKPEAVIEPGLKIGIPFTEPVQLCPELCIGFPFREKCVLACLVNAHTIHADRRSRA